MRAIRLNLTIEQGSTYSNTWTFLEGNAPRDFAGFSARMQIRKRHGDPVALASLGTEQGGIELGNDGRVTIQLTADETAAIPAGYHVYDLKISRDDYAERLVEGVARVEPNVTR